LCTYCDCCVGSTVQTRQACFCDELGRKESKTCINSSKLSHGCGACLCCKYVAHHSLSISTHVSDLSRSQSVGLCVCVSVNLSVRKVYRSKMAECMWMPYGMLSGVGRGMGVLDGGSYR